jgi:hypothetical protein
MPDRRLQDRIRLGLLIGIGATAALVGGFAFLMAPGFIVTAMYGDGWGLVIGLPWALIWIITLSVVITAYMEDDDA